MRRYLQRICFAKCYSPVTTTKKDCSKNKFLSCRLDYLRHCFERFSLHCGKGPLRRMPQTKLWSNDAKEMYASFSDT